MSVLVHLGKEDAPPPPQGVCVYVGGESPPPMGELLLYSSEIEI